MVNTTDATLIEQCLQGDTQAFGLLVQQYQHMVYALILSYVHDFDEAKDLTQETFVSAYLHLADLKQPSRFGSWLKRTAINLCHNYYRKCKAEQAALKELCRSNSGFGYRELSSEIQTEKEIGEKVLEAINQLPQKYRQVLMMYYIDDLSSENIGNFLGITPTAVDQRLHRAREHLKDQMMTMVEHVLMEYGPDKTFTQEVMERALDRISEERQRYAYSKVVQYCDKVLNTLDNFDTPPAYHQLKAQILSERGAALYFLYGDLYRSLNDWEAGLEIEKKMGNRESYARSLIDIGGCYIKLGDSEHSLRYYEEAVALFRELEDEKGLAKALYWIGVQHLVTFLEKKEEDKFRVALSYFERSLETARRGSDIQQMVLSLAVVESLNQMVTKVDWTSLHAYGASRFDMKKVSSSLTWLEQPGFKWFPYRDSTQSLLSCAWSYLLWPRKLLKIPLQIGDSWTAPSFAYGHEKITATSTVECMRDIVCVPAGQFEGCIKLYTALERDGQVENEFYRNLNTHIAGIRLTWFAPGMGPVKLVYQHEDGATTIVELIEAEIKRTSGTYFPLQIANRWQYEVCNDQNDKVLHDTYWGAAQESGIYYIAQFEYVL